MATKHRKLFPAYTIGHNKTVECIYPCDPTCPYVCSKDPLYGYLPPPSPPPSSDPDYILSPYLIVTVSLIAALFLLLSYYVIIVKPFSGFGRRRSRTNDMPSREPDEEFQDQSRFVHPIWFITTAGLQQSVINSITLFRYKKDEGLIDVSVCSVCLSEFQEDEMLRLLPKCSHAFHISCIDTWLRSHTNCPMCRAPIVSDIRSNVTSGTLEQNSGNLNPNAMILLENTEVGGNQDRNDQENESRTGEQNAIQESGGLDVRGSKEIQKSCEIVYQQHLRENDIQQQNFHDSASVCIDIPHLHTENPEGSSVNDLADNVQEHDSHGPAMENEGLRISLQTASLPRAEYQPSSPVTKKKSLSCSGIYTQSKPGI